MLCVPGAGSENTSWPGPLKKSMGVGVFPYFSLAPTGFALPGTPPPGPCNGGMWSGTAFIVLLSAPRAGDSSATRPPGALFARRGGAGSPSLSSSAFLRRRTAARHHLQRHLVRGGGGAMPACLPSRPCAGSSSDTLQGPLLPSGVVERPCLSFPRRPRPGDSSATRPPGAWRGGMVERALPSCPPRPPGRPEQRRDLRGLFAAAWWERPCFLVLGPRPCAGDSSATPPPGARSGGMVERVSAFLVPDPHGEGDSSAKPL